MDKLDNEILDLLVEQDFLIDKLFETKTRLKILFSKIDYDFE